MSDAFDALLAPTDPVQPSARFAEELRSRLSAAASEAAHAVAAPATPPPARFQEPSVSTITPYLIVRNATAVLEFYEQAFGAVVHERLVDDNGRVGHSELTIGTSRLRLADEFPEFDILGPESRGGATCSFTLDVSDVDEVFAKAVALGATVRTEPADQFHGNRTASIADPAGQQWMLMAKIEDLSSDEYRSRAAAGGYEVQATEDDASGSTPSAAEASGPHDHQKRRHGVGDLYYFNIPVGDADRAARFYRAVLGWDVQGGHVANIAAPPGSIGDHYPPTDGIRLWFVVEDIHASVAKVRELGGTATEPTESESGWSSDCRDDQGTLFCLSVPSAIYSL